MPGMRQGSKKPSQSSAIKRSEHADGVLYTNSGYGRLIGQPGDVLLAFTVDGK